AYLGKNADAGAGSVSLHLSGPTTINATSNNTANAISTGAGVGLAAITLLHPSAHVNGATRIYVGPDTTLTASSVTGTADNTSLSNATAKVTAIGGVHLSTVCREAYGSHHTHT